MALTVTTWAVGTNTVKGAPLQEQSVAIGASAASSSAISGDADARERRMVRLATDTACHFTYGSSPTADTDSPFLPASGVEYFEMEAGWTVSVIETS